MIASNNTVHTRLNRPKTVHISKWVTKTLQKIQKFKTTFYIFWGSLIISSHFSTANTSSSTIFTLFWPSVHRRRWFWYLKNNKAKAKEILRPLLLKLITSVSSHPLKSGSEAIETTFWRSAAMKWRNTKKKLLHVQRAGKLNSLNGSNDLRGHLYNTWMCWNENF